MQGRKLTESERNQERMRLVATACELLESVGPTRCSLRQIAVAAGVSRSTPYTYFEHKEALLEAVRLEALARLSSLCREALASAAGIPERLASVGSAYIEFALGQPALYDLIYATQTPTEAHREAVSRYRRIALEPLREAAEAGLLVRPPEEVATVLWASTHGLIGLHRAQKIDDFPRWRQILGDTLAFGFVPRATP